MKTLIITLMLLGAVANAEVNWAPAMDLANQWANQNNNRYQPPQEQQQVPTFYQNNEYQQQLERNLRKCTTSRDPFSGNYVTRCD